MRQPNGTFQSTPLGLCTQMHKSIHKLNVIKNSKGRLNILVYGYNKVLSDLWYFLQSLK